jgi:hypothetical protein
MYVFDRKVGFGRSMPKKIQHERYEGEEKIMNYEIYVQSKRILVTMNEYIFNFLAIPQNTIPSNQRRKRPPSIEPIDRTNRSNQSIHHHSQFLQQRLFGILPVEYLQYRSRSSLSTYCVRHWTSPRVFACQLVGHAVSS